MCGNLGVAGKTIRIYYEWESALRNVGITSGCFAVREQHKALSVPS
jgi:hypothetical protein